MRSAHGIVLASLFMPWLVAGVAMAQLPEGFTDELYLDGFEDPVGIVFDTSGHGYVWDRTGHVFLVHHGMAHEEPFLDLSEEVGSWRDFGMLGFALDPDFATNGHVYCYYVVDRHHLVYFGTPDYDPAADWEQEATIGRITRYTADPSTGFETILPGSRLVLLGETIDAGIPITHNSHGTGTLTFGTDGTLLASVGDGAGFQDVDTGSLEGTRWETALADGILRTAENVGAFRAQMVDSLSGKILRLDPATGDGVPSNPFYDAAAPRAARSRVWSLGLRNPFRMGVRPGSGSVDPAAGNPGAIYVGDVGWGAWEELSVITEGGTNLGWPMFQGLKRQNNYTNATTYNLDVPNPFHGRGACDQPFLSFQELLREDRENHDAAFPAACDPSFQIPVQTPTFFHHRPALDWHHTVVQARVPTFLNGIASHCVLGEPDCHVAGESFNGRCSIAGVWLGPTGMGPFGGSYLLMDFDGGWMRSLRFDEGQELELVDQFGGVAAPIYATQNPADGSLLYVSVTESAIRRIHFSGSSNTPPEGALASHVSRGESPLTVRFDGTDSVDPDGLPLTFHWDFGDGETSLDPSPHHTYSNLTGLPLSRTTTLTVTDQGGEATATQRVVHIDNSPPRAKITGLPEDFVYPSNSPVDITLEADVSDAESQVEALTFAWQLFLAHDNHEHPEPVVTGDSATFTLSPTPCGSSFYAYRIELTVTDPAGLATTVDRWVLPGCVPDVVDVRVARPDDPIVPGQESTLVATVDDLHSRVDFFVDSERVATSFAPPHRVPWTPSKPGKFVLSALAQTAAGGATSVGVPLRVARPVTTESAVSIVRDDAEEAPDGSVDTAASTLALGPHLVGVRVPLDVPQGATLVSAHLEFTAAVPGSIVTTVGIRAQDADAAAPIAPSANNLSLRPTTSSIVSWTIEPWVYAMASGGRQRTVDLSGPLQEVVDRPGFRRGNPVLLLLQGGGAREAYSYDPKGRPIAPRLVVEYAVFPPTRPAQLDGF